MHCEIYFFFFFYILTKNFCIFFIFQSQIFVTCFFFRFTNDKYFSHIFIYLLMTNILTMFFILFLSTKLRLENSNSFTIIFFWGWVRVEGKLFLSEPRPNPRNAPSSTLYKAHKDHDMDFTQGHTRILIVAGNMDPSVGIRCHLLIICS